MRNRCFGMRETIAFVDFGGDRRNMLRSHSPDRVLKCTLFLGQAHLTLPING